MMKKAQQMTTMLPMGFSEDISVSTTSFRPCARLITLGREGDQRGSPSSDMPLPLALLPRPPILVPWSPGLRLREEAGFLGWLGRVVFLGPLPPGFPPTISQNRKQTPPLSLPLPGCQRGPGGAG